MDLETSALFFALMLMNKEPIEELNSRRVHAINSFAVLMADDLRSAVQAKEAQANAGSRNFTTQS
jgi:hypothetical protein